MPSLVSAHLAILLFTSIALRAQSKFTREVDGHVEALQVGSMHGHPWSPAFAPPASVDAKVFTLAMTRIASPKRA